MDTQNNTQPQDTAAGSLPTAHSAVQSPPTQTAAPQNSQSLDELLDELEKQLNDIQKKNSQENAKPIDMVVPAVAKPAAVLPSTAVPAAPSVRIPEKENAQPEPKPTLTLSELEKSLNELVKSTDSTAAKPDIKTAAPLAEKSDTAKTTTLPTKPATEHKPLVMAAPPAAPPLVPRPDMVKQTNASVFNPQAKSAVDTAQTPTTQAPGIKPSVSTTLEHKLEENSVTKKPFPSANVHADDGKASNTQMQQDKKTSEWSIDKYSPDKKADANIFEEPVSKADDSAAATKPLKKSRFGGRQLALIFGSLALVIGLAVGLVFIKQSQDARRQAMDSEGGEGGGGGITSTGDTLCNVCKSEGGKCKPNAANYDYCEFNEAVLPPGDEPPPNLDEEMKNYREKNKKCLAKGEDSEGIVEVWNGKKCVRTPKKGIKDIEEKLAEAKKAQLSLGLELPICAKDDPDVAAAADAAGYDYSSDPTNLQNSLAYNPEAGTYSYMDYCAPDVTPGQSCSSLPTLSNGSKRFSEGEKYNGAFVGCSESQNCFCPLDSSGNVDTSSTAVVTCVDDYLKDSCGIDGSPANAGEEAVSDTGEVPVCNSRCNSNLQCSKNMVCDKKSGRCRNPSCVNESDCSCPQIVNSPTPPPTTPPPVSTTPPPAVCNSTCTSNSSCQTGQICDTTSGRCRNPSCLADSDCVCSSTAPHSPTPPPVSPPPTACNDVCTNNASCPSTMVCDTSSGRCRNPSCLTETDCVCGVQTSPTPSPLVDAGFQVIKFEDKNNNATFDTSEFGLSWNFEWDLNGDNNWRSYVTYASDNGSGGRVGSLADGDRIRVREVVQSGWSATTPTTREITVRQGETVVVRFGNRLVTTTTYTASSAPVVQENLPKAGSTTPSAVLIVAGAVISVLGIIGFLAM
jgi:hypothetical protein